MYVHFYAIHMYLHVCDYQYVLHIYICVCVRIRALKIWGEINRVILPTSARLLTLLLPHPPCWRKINQKANWTWYPMSKYGKSIIMKNIEEYGIYMHMGLFRNRASQNRDCCPWLHIYIYTHVLGISLRKKWTAEPFSITCFVISGLDVHPQLLALTAWTCMGMCTVHTGWGPQDSVQLPYKWLNSIVYGRYSELVNGGYNGI